MSIELELKNLVEQGNREIAALRAEIDGQKSADVLTEQKMARIEADLTKTLSEKSALETRLNALESAAVRPNFGTKQADAETEVKSAFFDYMRNDTAKGRYDELARKSISTAASSGGVMVPAQLGAELLRIATERSPLRQLARVLTVPNTNYTESLMGKLAGGLVGETDTRAMTADPNLGKVEPRFGEFYALPEVTNAALHDTFFNLEGELTRAAAETFEEYEANSFINGHASLGPKGLLAADSGIATVKTGKAATFGDKPFDALNDMFYGLKGIYSQNGTWLASPAVIGALAKVQDANGNYMFRMSVAAGQPDTLLGRPVKTDARMPLVAAGTKPLLFGDFHKGYVICDIAGVEVIVDRTSKKGFTQFYFSKRTGGAVALAEALVALEVKA